ncbi:MAG TPA: M28 family peptidase [Bryobacteraceae bacterium]|jgi:aminopeptidase YwaD|nr:M28 family peptidase [Bryobacteraceae bacterium]
MLRKIFFLLGLAGTVFAATIGDAAFDANRYLDRIKYLASPEMRGRESGSPELEKAAQYIASQFKADGLKAPDGKSYLQPFEVTTSAKPGKTNRFEFSIKGETQELQIAKEFEPFSFSAHGKASAAVVFAGYGITAPEYNYDDYAGIDVKGKFVLVLKHEPQEYDEKSVFEGKIYTDHSQDYSKAANARRHGAAGVILINDQINHKTAGDDLDAFGAERGPTDAGILFVQVKEQVVEPWFKAEGKDLMDLERGIDTDVKPRSFAFKNVEVRENVDVERVVKTVHNVLAYLPGQTDEYLIIGAHYDHLGLGGTFSLARSLTGTVHPGADDNASGTAGVIELARHFSALSKPKRGILFMTFAGEELGLLGSGYYANHPELPLDKAVTMINMDMIGRVRDGKLYIGGAATGTTLRKDLDGITPRFPLHVDYSDNSGYGSSDHTSFTTKQIPVLFFFSGLHGDYHKPSDTWDKIDAPDAVEVLQLVADITDRLDNDSERPQFVRVEEKENNPHAGQLSGSGGAGGYGPYFGSIPDFAEPPRGVRFADITPGSPAGKAGLKAGDILIQFGADPIQNLYDFTYALRAHKAGEEVEVEVLRNNQQLKVKVLLTERH